LACASVSCRLCCCYLLVTLCTNFNNNNNNIKNKNNKKIIIINAADVPAVKEPSGLNRQFGKRPDGLSLIPWQSGKPLLWDVTVASTLAGSYHSYVDTAATGAGLVADQAADRKTAKYADLRAQHVFQPVLVENLGPFRL